MTGTPDNRRFNGRDTGVALAIVSSVAAYANTPPDELPPLYEVIDPDALERLFPSDADGEVLFSYAGYRVRVSFGEENEVEVTEEES